MWRALSEAEIRDIHDGTAHDSSLGRGAGRGCCGSVVTSSARNPGTQDTPGHSRTLPGHSPDTPGHSPDTLRAISGHSPDTPRTLPGHSPDTPRTHSPDTLRTLCSTVARAALWRGQHCGADSTFREHPESTQRHSESNQRGQRALIEHSERPVSSQRAIREHSESTQRSERARKVQSASIQRAIRKYAERCTTIRFSQRKKILMWGSPVE